MAVTVLSNKKNSTVTLHINASNTMTIVGNTVNGSNVAIGDENITGATINKAVWGVADGGNIQVKRNTTIVAVYSGSGESNYTALASPITANSAETLAVTINGTANGYIILELNKLGVIEGQY